MLHHRVSINAEIFPFDIAVCSGDANPGAYGQDEALLREQVISVQQDRSDETEITVGQFSCQNRAVKQQICA